MTRIRHHSARSRRPSDGGSGAWWFARWLIVLVIAFDLLSAPFHQHHHEGVDGQLGFSTALVSLDDMDSHAEEANQPLASHSAMAIRIDPSRLGQLPAVDNPAEQVALVWVVRRLAAAGMLPSEHWRPDRSRPDFRSHRSLPPDSRAPPLHA